MTILTYHCLELFYLLFENGLNCISNHVVSYHLTGFVSSLNFGRVNGLVNIFDGEVKKMGRNPCNRLSKFDSSTHISARIIKENLIGFTTHVN